MPQKHHPKRTLLSFFLVLSIVLFLLSPVSAQRGRGGRNNNNNGGGGINNINNNGGGRNNIGGGGNNNNNNNGGGGGRGRNKGGDSLGQSQKNPNGAANTNAPPPPSAFCRSQRGLTPSDGTQIQTGACSSTVMGAIPTVDKMVSTIIISPQSGSTVRANQDMTVNVRVSNLDTGFFSDPNTQYYLTPQTLSSNGLIQGHSHVTIQKLNSNTSPPDPTQFDFFKGLDEQANNAGILSVTVPGGTLSQGQYRICTMSGSDSHQPVIMPIAQRGAQDDCIRVRVV
ncbi:hypothetical protein HK104_002468 [Borealophlyctis nickersoniae]|nr:hypothetical protein HK104_002468 [Borealophlyctis nickersoniae]